MSWTGGWESVPMPEDGPPTRGHVYVLFRGLTVVYVGQTTGLQSRLLSHRRGNRRVDPKEFDRALAIELPVDELRPVEGALIRRFNPPYVHGGAWRDESRDVELLARFGLAPDKEARDAFVARRYVVVSKAMRSYYAGRSEASA